jgi:hypothetical protein
MGRQKAMVLGAFLSALGTQALWADDNRAVPRGGGSSGGGHSSSGSSQRSSGSSGSSGSSYSDSSSGRSHHSRAPRTEAQRRKPTPGTGSGYRHGRGGYYGGYGGYYGGYGYGYPYWNYGYYWSPWYYPSYGGFYGGYGHYGYGPSYGYSRGYSSDAGSVRVMVEPRKTKVYVDDYYAGVADDFDGMFQRLNLSTGRHDISLRLDGYETHRVKLYVPVAGTIKIKHEMVKGASDKVSESTVGEPVPEPRYARESHDDDDYENSPEHRDETRPDNRGERGTVRLDVSPSDASIYVDGVFRGTGQDLRRVTLPEGTHRLEVVRPGYRTFERDVEVTAGEVEEVDIDLPRS